MIKRHHLWLSIVVNQVSDFIQKQPDQDTLAVYRIDGVTQLVRYRRIYHCHNHLLGFLLIKPHWFGLIRELEKDALWLFAAQIGMIIVGMLAVFDYDLPLDLQELEFLPHR